MIGENIRAAREAKGYKQIDLAIRMHISPTRLNFWEKNKREPNIQMLQKLSYVLEVSCDYLIFGKEALKRGPVLTEEKQVQDILDQNTIKLAQKLIKAGVLKEGEDLTQGQLEKILRVLRIVLEDVDE